MNNYPDGGYEELSDWTQKQIMLKGKLILKGGIPLSQTQKCVFIHKNSKVFVENLLAGKDFDYKLSDKPGWLNGSVVNAYEYGQYLNTMNP